jgi:hypothetical protein
MSDTQTGRCLCGNIRFEAKGRRLWVAHCHCESCRRSTGAPVTTFVGFNKDQLTYTHGERKFYESSPGVRRGFCADCGTPMTYEADRSPDEVHLYISTLDEPGAFQPQLHVFHAERIPWVELNDDLPRHSGFSSDGGTTSWGPLHDESDGENA